MGPSQNIALVLVRFLGLVSLVFGILWFANLLLVGAISIAGAPEWFTTGIWAYTVQGLLSGPLWFASGLLLMRFSKPIARFVSKGVENNET